jgi:hypothetical protein
LFKILLKSQLQKAPDEIHLNRDNPFDDTIFEGKDDN